MRRMRCGGGEGCSRASVLSMPYRSSCRTLEAQRASRRLRPGGSAWRGSGNRGLNPPDHGPELTGREEPRPERPRGVLAEQRQARERRSGLGPHVLELPADLTIGRIDPLRRRQRNRPRGIGRRTEGVRSHVSNTGGLRGSAGRGHGSGGAHLARSPAGDETPTNLLGGPELTPAERPRPSDRVARPAVFRSLRLEHPQHPLGAIRGPQRDETPIGLAEGLRRRHASIIAEGRTRGGGEPRGSRT